jgi:hypothetical protein
MESTKKRGRPSKNTFTQTDENNMAQQEITDVEFEETKSISGNNIIDNIPDPNDYNPLSKPVIEREYTAGLAGNAVADNSSDAGQPIPEPIYSPPVDISNGDIPMGDSDIPMGDGGTSAQSGDAGEFGNPSMKDLSYSQKKKNSELTADALLYSFTQHFPAIFTYICTIDEKKIQKMEVDGEIDLSIYIEGFDLTIGESLKKFNADVHAAFVITEEDLIQIREPLIEVLMENNLALTSTQRLIYGIGSLTLKFGVNAYQIIQGKNQMIEIWKQTTKIRNEESDKLKAEIEELKREKREREEKDMKSKSTEKEVAEDNSSNNTVGGLTMDDVIQDAEIEEIN